MKTPGGIPGSLKHVLGRKEWTVLSNLRLLLIIVLTLLHAGSTYSQSVCRGTPASGSVSGAVRLPEEGENFEVYRWRGGVNRLFVHTAVAQALEEAYRTMSMKRPAVRFVIGETGLEQGGPFPPHKTHQNGTSVDLFVPVRNVAGEEVPFPNDYRNGYGYKVRFDALGNSSDGKHRVDFEALADYIGVLREAARTTGIDIARVVLIKDFELKLHSTPSASKLRGLRFFDDPNDRHDNHIHVDFQVPCAR